jgi:ABC-type multidrug transport system permease subunit
MNLPIGIEETFIEIRAVVYMVILFSILLTSFLIYSQENGFTRGLYERFFQNPTKK